MNVIKKRIPSIKEENVKSEIPSTYRSRDDSPWYKEAMRRNKNLKAFKQIPAEKHGLSPEEHAEKIRSMEGGVDSALAKHHEVAGNPNMAAIHKKRAGAYFREEFQSEAEVSHKQKMMDYALKASERAVNDAKDFATGKIDKNDRIQRRLEFIKKALKRVNDAG